MSSINISERLEDGNTIGAIMRGERLTLGKSLDDVFHELRIRKADIESIEANDMSKMDRPEFAAGNIRTYARYLKLDPKETLEAFRANHGFKPAQVTPKKVDKRAKHVNTAMNVGFYKAPPKSGATKFFENFTKLGMSVAPLVIFVGVIGTLTFYGVRFFTSMQELNVVAVETQPAASIEVASAAVDTSVPSVTASTINYDELYARQALNVPVIKLRDGPIAEIATQAGNNDVSVEIAAVEPASEPMVSVGPIVPIVELLPFGEAWVQINTDAGDTILEKLLKPGEVVPVPIEGSVNFLKAGNATQLYVRVNGEVFGPIGKDGNHVVRNVPMLPTELKADFQPISVERLAELQTLETSYLAKLEAQ